MIDSYSFGSMVINGKKYRSDVIIFPDKIKANWWRRSGHQLLEEDIREIIEYMPQILVIGTGAYGLMKVDDKAKDKLKSLGINCIIKKTSEAVKEFNKISKDKKVIGAFHLTC